VVGCCGAAGRRVDEPRSEPGITVQSLHKTLYFSAIFWYNKSMKPTPREIKFRESLFWDTNLRTIDPKRDAVYVIERIMNLGYDYEVRWMWHTYSRQLLRKVANTSENLDKKSRVFWRLMLKPERKRKLRMVVA